MIESRRLRLAGYIARMKFSAFNIVVTAYRTCNPNQCLGKSSQVRVPLMARYNDNNNNNNNDNDNNNDDNNNNISSTQYY